MELLKVAALALLLEICGATQSPRTENTRIRRSPSSRILNDLILAKQRSGLRNNYVNGLRQYLTRFVLEHPAIESITPADIERWLDDRGEKGSTRASNLGRLSALFSYAVRKGVIDKNPVDRVERVRITSKPPKILTVDQAGTVLRHTHDNRPDMLAWLTLALLCGVRPEEAQKLTWQDIDLEAGTVTIAAAVSKVHRRRIVHPRENALGWLIASRKLGARLPIPPTTRRRFIRDLRAILGFKTWPQDVLRHTAASYWLAAERNAGKVALELGNSERILLRHYQELVTESEAKRFWKLAPAGSEPPA